MSSARIVMPTELDDLLKSEMEACIDQANLGTVDTMIARRYLIDKWPQIEIAAELGWARSTVSDRMPRILQKMVRTAQKMYPA